MHDAARLFRKGKRIGYVTFGAVQPRKGDGHFRKFLRDVDDFLKDRVQSVETRGQSTLVGWVAGTYNWKTAHFDNIIQLLDRAEESGHALVLVVVIENPADVERYAPALLEILSGETRVFLHLGHLRIDEAELAARISFYWRAYRDLSVGFTVYEAASQGKPILALDMGFVGRAIQHYGLGAVVKSDFSNIASALDEVVSWTAFRADEFLKSHTWAKAADQMRPCFGENGHCAKQ